MHVLAVFGNVRVCHLHHTSHMENHKQHTADLQLVALFPSHLVFVQFFGWWCVFLGSDPEVVSSQYVLRFGL